MGARELLDLASSLSRRFAASWAPCSVRGRGRSPGCRSGTSQPLGRAARWRCKWAPSRNRRGAVSPAGCSEERGCPGGALVHSLLPPCLSRCAGSLPPRLLLRAGSPVSSAEYYVSTRSERAQQRPAPHVPDPTRGAPVAGRLPGRALRRVEGEARGVTLAEPRRTHRPHGFHVLNRPLALLPRRRRGLRCPVLRGARSWGLRRASG